MKITKRDFMPTLMAFGPLVMVIWANQEGMGFTQIIGAFMLMSGLFYFWDKINALEKENDDIKGRIQSLENKISAQQMDTSETMT